jgi:CBS domain-containing protein
MRIQQIMTRCCACIAQDGTLQEAAHLMRDLNVGFLPVDDGDRLVGMVTDRDITVRATAAGLDPRTTPVREAMTPELVYCFQDQDIRDAARLMKDKQIRRLAVLNRERRLAGILTLGDLAVHTGDEQLVGETLERISEPATSVP